MKRFFKIALSFFVFQFALCANNATETDFKEIALSNNINVLLHEDFRSPIVVVEVTFHVREIDEPLNKYALREIISANLVDAAMHNKLSQIGAEYYVCASDFGIEFYARVNSEHLKELFLLICEIAARENIKIQHIDITKTALMIEEQLAEIYKVRAASDNVFSLFDRKWPYDKRALSSVTETDVMDFINDRVRNCHISIIVCGAVGYKSLLKILQSSVSNLSSRETKPEYKDKIQPVNCEISIKDKYISNGVQYVYYTPSISKKDLQVFWEIVHKEIFRFLSKTSKVIRGYHVNRVPRMLGNLYIVTLLPKSDVSIEEVKKLYQSFTQRMCNVSLTPERISEIAQITDTENKIKLSDLENICSLISEGYVGSIDLATAINLSTEISKTPPEKIKSIASSIFGSGPAVTVKMQFSTGM